MLSWFHGCFANCDHMWPRFRASIPAANLGASTAWNRLPWQCGFPSGRHHSHGLNLQALIQRDLNNMLRSQTTMHRKAFLRILAHQQKSTLSKKHQKWIGQRIPVRLLNVLQILQRHISKQIERKLLALDSLFVRRASQYQSSSICLNISHPKIPWWITIYVADKLVAYRDTSITIDPPMFVDYAEARKRVGNYWDSYGPLQIMALRETLRK